MPSLLFAAADHPWRLDLSTLASILVAVGTGALAFYTWWLARQTRDLARETEEDVRAEWRPVLLEDTLTTVLARRGENLATLILTLTNTGRGPALNGHVTVASESSTEKLADESPLATIAPNGVTRVDFGGMLYRDSSGGPQSRLNYTVTAIYEDLSGRTHTTVLSYEDPERGNRTAAQQEVNYAPDLTHTSMRVEPA